LSEQKSRQVWAGLPTNRNKKEGRADVFDAKTTHKGLETVVVSLVTKGFEFPAYGLRADWIRRSHGIAGRRSNEE
jgi:hypothetical protein